jgi:hypothetical protein
LFSGNWEGAAGTYPYIAKIDKSTGAYVNALIGTTVLTVTTTRMPITYNLVNDRIYSAISFPDGFATYNIYFIILSYSTLGVY